MPKLKLLVADDDAAILSIISVFMKEAGYEVITARNGDEAYEKARKDIPDVILLDIFMPGMSGIDVCKKLREDRTTYLIPIVILTADSSKTSKLDAMRVGADDFIIKPFDIVEVEARLQSLLRRIHQSRSSNPLTGLPGNLSIQHEISKRIKRDETFCVCYADLSNFKSFNDRHGFERGDEIIKMLARLIIQAVEEGGNADDFVGHIGGDDFIFITQPSRVEWLCSRIITWFDELIPGFYDPEEREKGQLELINRKGEKQIYPFMTLAIGVATNEKRTFLNPLQVSEIASELKNFAKTRRESSFVLDRRTDDDPAPKMPAPTHEHP